MRTWLGMAVAGWLAAQEPRKPVELIAVCGDAEIQEFGLECTNEEPCAAYLELTSVEPLGAKLFLAGNFHTQTVTLWSLLLMSEDEGKTWIEPHPRVRGSALDQIQFVDFENGWASGHVAGNLPRDPFLLKTTDGGKKWRSIAVFEDTAYGSIEQFRFDTKSHGMLVLDRRGSPSGRYQRMETMTGGDSWMMREVSPKPIGTPRPQGSTSNNADWRVRVDAATKTFRVERRQEGKWMPVSSFLVGAGACRPSPPKEPEKTPEKSKDPEKQ